MSTASTVEFYRGFFYVVIADRSDRKMQSASGDCWGSVKVWVANLVWLTICDMCSGQVGSVIAYERWELNRMRPKGAV